MKKIIVAGAGHGGLTAAGNLALKGYDVTVYEKKERCELGYDWNDVFDRETFGYCGVPLPDEKCFHVIHSKTFCGPDKKVKLYADGPDAPQIKDDHTRADMDRKELYRHLVSWAENCGVKLRFGTEILSAIAADNKVYGILAKQDGEYRCLLADLVIDACGMNSPIRRNLPASFHIVNEVKYGEMFHAYRAFYNRDGDISDQYYNIYLYHAGKCGISWFINCDGYCDVLLGRFDDIDENSVEEVLADMRQDHPELGTEVLHGGKFVDIPVRRALGKLVADGYALVGDSACMTLPMIGSGINFSMKAGKMLADTIIDSDGDFSVGSLWNYQLRYYDEINSKILLIDKIRVFVNTLSEEDTNFMLNKKLISQNEISAATGSGGLSLGFRQIVSKAVSGITNIPLLLGMVHTLDTGDKLIKHTAGIPREWDEETCTAWIDTYEKL